MLFFKEEYRIEEHIGESFDSLGLIIPEKNIIVVCRTDIMQFAIQPIEKLQHLLQLFKQPKIKQENADFEKTLITTRIKIADLPETDDLFATIKFIEQTLTAQRWLKENFPKLFET